LDLKEEMEKLTDVYKEKTDPEEELDDIQWLKAKYGNVLEREQNLLDHLIKVLGDFEYRLKVIEEKLE
jgi:hypothetical protein